MNKVIVALSTNKHPHHRLELEVIEDLARDNDVTVLVCNGELPSCWGNPTKLLSICQKCISTRKHNLDLLSRKVNIVSYGDCGYLQQASSIKSHLATLSTFDEIRNFQHDKFLLGVAAMSTVISCLRDPYPLESDENLDLARRSLLASVIAYVSVYNLLNNVNKVDAVYVVNGRLAELAGVFFASQSCQIDTYTFEYVYADTRWSYFKNHRIHDLGAMKEVIRDYFSNNWTPKGMIATQLYYSSRLSGTVLDTYTGRQKLFDFKMIDETMNNIAIFISSEDEYASIGPEWANPIFINQYEGLKYIISHIRSCNSDAHIYIRMHPSLIDVENSYVKEFHSLTSEHVTVIAPDSEVSSYILGLSCSTIVTFGSEIGTEFAMLGRRVIQVGRSLFEDSGIVCLPTTCDQLDAELKNKQTSFSVADSARMYGFWRATYGRDHYHFCENKVATTRIKNVAISTMQNRLITDIVRFKNINVRRFLYKVVDACFAFVHLLWHP